MPQHLLVIPGNNPAWLPDEQSVCSAEEGQQREGEPQVALRKQTENQTSLPWKVKHREDSSPFINKAGREWENFYKLVTENNTRNV